MTKSDAMNEEGGSDGQGEGDQKGNDESRTKTADTVTSTATAAGEATMAAGSSGSSGSRSVNNTNSGGQSHGHNTAAPPAATPAVTALNVYKKVAIIRGSGDVLTYEDGDGNVKSITDLHLAALATTRLQKPKPKDEIPVPTIKTVETYQKDITPDYEIKTAYVRYNRPTDQELRENLEYVVDAEDDEWLRKNTKFGGSINVALKLKEELDAAAAEGAQGSADDDDDDDGNSTAVPVTAASTTKQLPIEMFEIIMDELEKATAFDAIVTFGQAQDLILQRLPQLYSMYPVKAPRNQGGNRSSSSSNNNNDNSTNSSSGTGAISSAAPIVTLRHVLSDVYQYWVSKRSKLKRPLLRRFWPVTSTDDTNPHLVFRPREKEKYKLRKKRQDDMDAYRKLHQLKEDFSQIRLILSLVQKREELNRSLVILQKEWFEQKLYDAVDTSGLRRISQSLDRKSLDELMEIETYYEVQDANGPGRRSKKSSRRGNGGTESRTASRTTSPIPELSSVHYGLTSRGAAALQSGGPDIKPPINIAGRNHGEPAPLFLHPLSTRESYATSWEGAVPHVTTYVDAGPEPTFRFRHRPRIGRGGRVVIDRVPMATDPNFPPITYFKAGCPPPATKQPKQRLLDLLPEPLDHDMVGRRIEDICLAALKEDYDTTYQAAVAPGSTITTTAAEAEENDGRAVVVKMADWLDTDEQLWGEERYSVGPI